jgi:signal transduction histidine kinase
LDKKGLVIASTDEKSMGTDKSTDACFTGGQKNIYIKDAFYSEAIKKRIMDVSGPMFDSETGEFLGIIVARIELTDLYKIVTDNTGFGNTEETYIVNKYNYMITPSKFLKDTFLKQRVDTENLRSCILNRDKGGMCNLKGNNIILSPDYRGVMVAGSNAYIKEMRWCLLSKVDRDEVLAPLAKIEILALIIMLVTPLIAWLLGIFISALITGPLLKLHKGTEIIGEGNLDYKVGIDTKDEVGQLSRAFDNMTGHLKVITTSIDTLNKEVEQRKQAEAKLENANERLKKLDQLKSDFVANVSHEFKNPLARIKESLSLMLDEVIGKINPKQEEILELGKRSIDRLIRLVTDLLDLSKIEAGKMDMKREVIEIEPLLDEILREYKKEISDKRLTIDKQVPKDIGSVWADKDKLTEVIINLLSNAIKYTPSGNKIIIKFSGDEKEVRFEIADTGPGIAKENLEKIFNKFERILAERQEGTGLGLSIAKDIVKLHKGKIWVESPAWKDLPAGSQGSRFIFTLPRDLRKQS